MPFTFEKINRPATIAHKDWINWKWQLRHSLQSLDDFTQHFSLHPSETKAFQEGAHLFATKTTPYYSILCKKYQALRKMTIPHHKELDQNTFSQIDPLGEKKHNPTPRIIHRYPDRVLFLVTDFCGIYCRYCTRKYFTAKNHHFIPQKLYQKALDYISHHTGIREVILSGGDPLTLSDLRLDQILTDIRKIPHIEIIRIGTKMLTVCPFRVTKEFIGTIKKHQPVFIMTHFNHPKEITFECKSKILQMCNAGISIYNQMVLLNGINNHPALVQALNRRLLYLRVKPYYMFQCDPSVGTDHFRTTIENSKWIQKELWGILSGLASPKLSMDLPDGGGKVELVPDHLIKKNKQASIHKGFDGIQSTYRNSQKSILPKESDILEYLKEWKTLRTQTYGSFNKQVPYEKKI